MSEYWKWVFSPDCVGDACLKQSSWAEPFEHLLRLALLTFSPVWKAEEESWDTQELLTESPYFPHVPSPLSKKQKAVRMGRVMRHSRVLHKVPLLPTIQVSVIEEAEGCETGQSHETFKGSSQGSLTSHNSSFCHRRNEQWPVVWLLQRTAAGQSPVLSRWSW